MSSTEEDVLENRIVELEKLIFGLQGKPENDEPILETSIVESLAHLNTLLSSALSGREKLNTLIQRLPEIESYIDSDFEPTELQIEAKLEYIKMMEPEIRENVKRYEQLKELLPVLDSDRFKNLPEMSEKLHDLLLKYLKIDEESENMTAEVKDMITRYNCIMTHISKSLIALDNEITALEKAAEPEKVVD